MSARLASAPVVEILPERPADAAAVEAVIARAFGPGRRAKAAERLREGNTPRAELCFTAWVDGVLAGAVRLWTVHIGGRPIVLLGPIAVEAEHRSEGLGAALVEAAVAAADAAGERAVLLVGDLPLFGPLGFVRAENVTLPGPVDPARVLIRVLRGEAPVGAVTAPRATTPAAARR